MHTPQRSLPPTTGTPPTSSLPKYLQEDGITQECKDLLTTLTTERDVVANHLYQFQGFWYTSRNLQGLLNCQKHFRAQDTDILLVSIPKSGTTWLKAMIFSLVNRVHYPDPQNHPLGSRNPHDIVPFLELNLYIDNQIPDLSSLGSPRILASHLPLVSMPQSVKDSSCKLVYLCRNPKDTLVSLWHFSRKLRPEEIGSLPLEDAFDMFSRGVNLCGPFWDHVLEYWKESLEKPQRVLFLKYEEIKRDPTTSLKRLAEFLDCPFSIEEEKNGVVKNILNLCSFDNLSALEVNRSGKLSSGVENQFFFRRGEIGDYMNHLSKEMIEYLDRTTEEKLNRYGLNF